MFNRKNKNDDDSEKVLQRILGDLQDALDSKDGIEVEVVKLNKKTGKLESVPTNKYKDEFDELEKLKRKVHDDSMTNNMSDDDVFQHCVDSCERLIKTVDRPLRNSGAFVITKDNNLIMSTVNIGTPEEAIRVFSKIIDAIKLKYNV